MPRNDLVTYKLVANFSQSQQLIAMLLKRDASVTAFAMQKDLKQFRDKHLSKIGKKDYLPRYEPIKNDRMRLTTRRLDMDISLSAHLALEPLVRELGLTKIQLIE